MDHASSVLLSLPPDSLKPFFLHSTGPSFLPNHQRLQPSTESLLSSHKISLLNLLFPLFPLQTVIFFRDGGGEVVVAVVKTYIFGAFVVVLGRVVIEDGDELCEFLVVSRSCGWYFLLTYSDEVLAEDNNTLRVWSVSTR